jgi:hypothetical protein
MEIVEKVVGSDVVISWFDEYIGQDNNCTELKKEFESSTTNIYLYHDVDQYRRFLKSIRNKKHFCIIQGKHAQTIVPDIINFAIPPVVYIFCTHMFTLTEWAQAENIECILNGGIFDHEKDLLGKLTVDLADYATFKVQEYRVKRAACDEWADKLTKNAKRLRTEKCTLPFFRTDPFDAQETPCEQPGE